MGSEDVKVTAMNMYKYFVCINVTFPCFLEWLGRLKWRATGLDASLSFFSTSRRCSRNRSPSRLPVSPMYNLLHNVGRDDGPL